MQFGRFHGIALLALGALLLFVQTAVVFREKARPSETTASATQAEARQPSSGPGRGLEYMSGVLGVVLAGAGGYVLAQASRKSERDQLERERREEDRSFGRQGHHVSTPTIWKER
jgi:cobalamin biosynthesis protein CobD/CbiB